VTCDTRGGKEKCVPCSGRENWRKETIWKNHA